MKQTLLFICFLAFGVIAKAQGVDSNEIRVPVTLQIRDWYKVESFIQNREPYENLYDSLKAGLRASAAGATSTVTAMRTMPVRNAIGIAQFIRTAPYSDAFFYFTRINNALRAVNNVYLQRRLDELDEMYQTQYEATLQREYLRVRNPQ